MLRLFRQSCFPSTRFRLSAVRGMQRLSSHRNGRLGESWNRWNLTERWATVADVCKIQCVSCAAPLCLEWKLICLAGWRRTSRKFHGHESDMSSMCWPVLSVRECSFCDPATLVAWTTWLGFHFYSSSTSVTKDRSTLILSKLEEGEPLKQCCLVRCWPRRLRRGWNWDFRNCHQEKSFTKRLGRHPRVGDSERASNEEKAAEEHHQKKLLCHSQKGAVLEEAPVVAEIEIEAAFLNVSEDDWAILEHEDHEEEHLEMPSEAPTAAEQPEVPLEARTAAEPATLANRMTEKLRALRILHGSRCQHVFEHLTQSPRYMTRQQLSTLDAVAQTWHWVMRWLCLKAVQVLWRWKRRSRRLGVAWCAACVWKWVCIPRREKESTSWSHEGNSPDLCEATHDRLPTWRQKECVACVVLGRVGWTFITLWNQKKRKSNWNNALNVCEATHMWSCSCRVRNTTALNAAMGSSNDESWSNWSKKVARQWPQRRRSSADGHPVLLDSASQPSIWDIVARKRLMSRCAP